MDAGCTSAEKQRVSTVSQELIKCVPCNGSIHLWLLDAEVSGIPPGNLKQLDSGGVQQTMCHFLTHLAGLWKAQQAIAGHS